MSRKNQIILHRLMKKGFQVKMSKHIKLTFVYRGQNTGIRTWISHGQKEISDKLLNIMAEQIHLSKQEFGELVDCTLDENGLIALYENKNLI